MHTLATRVLRTKQMPFLFCPGCGDGIVVHLTARAVDELGILDRLCTVGAIGCSSWIATYFNVDFMKILHGRALPAAIALKLTNPARKVLVFTGDGDCVGIGGNHFIHAARRNIDVTALVINNQIYGMTGGQYSPTTPVEALATTAPYGDAEPGFDLCGVAQAAGATFVGRVAPVRMPELINTLARALQHRGFSFVEAVSQCPVYFGRMNRLGGPVQMLMRQKEITLPTRAAQQNPDAAQGKLLTGVLYESERPAYEDLYGKVRLKASWKAGEHV